MSNRTMRSELHRHWTLTVVLSALIGTCVSCSLGKTWVDTVAPVDAGVAVDADLTDDTGPPSLCAEIAGQTFRSVAQMECGLGANGQVALCKWTIDFQSGAYRWRHSDVGEIGTYSCEGQTFFMQPEGGAAIAVPYDPGRGRLTWQGADYVNTL